MQRKAKASMSVTTGLIITFGHDLQEPVSALSRDEQNQMYLRIAENITEHVGIELTGLVAHRDEVGHHAHGQCPARHPDGRPMGKVLTPAICSEIQTLAMEAAKEFLPMIERGKRKSDRIKDGDDPSTVFNRSVKQLHDDLPDELEAAKDELRVTSSEVLKMKNYVFKLEQKAAQVGELNAKEAKRLATYEKRLDVRKAREAEALKVLTRLQRATDEEQDARDIEQDARDADLDERELAVEVVQAEATALRDKLKGILRFVETNLGAVADMLGVAKTFNAISERIRTVILDEPEPDDDGTPSQGM